MGITQAFRNFLTARKGLEDRDALREWSLRDLAGAMVLFGERLLRGGAWRLRFGKTQGFVLCDRRVRIYHSRYIRSGAQLNLEEGCEIIGLSRQGIVFGHRCTVGRFACIRPSNILLDEPGEGMRLGDYSNIGAYSYVGCSGFIDIGHRVMMGPRVNLLAENHRFDDLDCPIREQGVERTFIRIEDDCWIGAGSTIVAGVTVGSGAVVAAGAVVTRDVAPNAVVGGIPARTIRKRGGRSGG